ncbi:MAG: hypothetical protein GWO02_07365 [Gammaproteobacteria bacterium]|nr:hypothetical protein [Gammaproteobacteria bacterium]
MGSAPRPLAAASYNVHRSIGNDGRQDTDRVAQVLAELEADVIGLQEVDSRSGAGHDSLQLDYLAQRTGLTAIPGPTIQRHDGYFGNALLTRLPVETVRHIDLSVVRREPRGLIDARLRWDAETVRALVTHLGLHARERRDQVRHLLAAVREGPAALVLLIGDVNEWLPLRPTLVPLHRQLGRAPAVRSFPSGWPVLSLDRIWVHPRARALSWSSHRSPLARVASDHLPVIARIEPSAR